MLALGSTRAAADDVESSSPVCEKAVIKKLNRHILIKFFLMTILCYIGRRLLLQPGWSGDLKVVLRTDSLNCAADRTNLAFAALQLNQSLGFSDKVYGLGSSIFFIGYSALQIPSNVRTALSISARKAAQPTEAWIWPASLH